jgi:hypothetical protein
MNRMAWGVDRTDFTWVACWRSDFTSRHLGELMNLLAHSLKAMLVFRGFSQENGLQAADFFRLNVYLLFGLIQSPIIRRKRCQRLSKHFM